MRNWTCWMVAAIVAVLGRGAMLHAAQPKKPLNVVFILADDFGWRDAHCYGSTFYETPNIDRLAKTGMKFTSGYASCPVCSPSRSAIMTGKYPVRTGITDYISPNGSTEPEHWTRNTKLRPAHYALHLDLNETTLAEAFKAAGYATFFAGKWHLGGKGFEPQDQGFDVNKGGCEWGHPKTYFSPYHNPMLTDGPKGEHLPHRLAEETIKFIDQHKGGPFLAYLSFYSVHTPLMGRKDLVAKYKKKKAGMKFDGPEFIPVERYPHVERAIQEHAVYAAMVDAMDQAIGNVLDELDKLGIADHTIVVFTGDNGGLSTSEGSPTSNLPLKAGKGWMYEGGIREPVIVRWPGVTKPGSTCDAPTIDTDFYPTLLDAAGLPPRPQQTLDGVSIVPLLRGQTSMPARDFYWHYPHYGNQGGFPSGAIREGDWKLIEDYEDGHVELYNITRDLGEHHDLAAQQPARVKEMHDKLVAWRKQTGALMPTPNPRFHADRPVDRNVYLSIAD